MPKPSTLTLSLNPKRSEVPPPLKSPQTPHHSPTRFGRRPSTEDDVPDGSSFPPLPQSPTSPKLPPDIPTFRPPPTTNKSRGREQIRKVPPESSTRPNGSSPGSSAASMSHRDLLDTVPTRTPAETVSLSDTVELTRSTDGDLEIPLVEKEKKSNSIAQVDPGHVAQKRLRGQRFNQLLHSKSIRKGPEAPRPANVSTRGRFLEPKSHSHSAGLPPKTAPLEPDRSFREIMGSTIRNKSADRTTVDSQDGSETGPPKSSSREAHRLLTNIKQSSTRAADGLGRAGRGLFGKFARSGSSGEREIAVDENYQFRIINLPLIEQTRRTRIRGRMEDAKDKTEFWMPALPYRCIDYLNLKGVEEEGLYRIPGSGREVKHWQTRFDIEGDVNLLDEDSLYDINTVCSMLKAWLRELPDELFPKSTQSAIASACAGATETPQMMKDELSKLPPFNYYLLFAVTCHIALLHANADRNKMTYSNLCICFQPCMGIDGFCFRFLVCNWRSCWQGCWTEKEYLAEEYRVLKAQHGADAADSSSSVAADTAPAITIPRKPARKLQEAPSFLTDTSTTNSVSNDSAIASSSVASTVQTRSSRPGTSSDTGRSPPPKPPRQSSPLRSTTPVQQPTNIQAHPAVAPLQAQAQRPPARPPPKDSDDTEQNGMSDAMADVVAGSSPDGADEMQPQPAAADLDEEDDDDIDDDDDDDDDAPAKPSVTKSPPSAAAKAKAKTRAQRRTSTPPTLEPVATVSPMRM